MSSKIVRFASKLAGVAFAAGLLATGCAAPTADTASDDATTPPANGVANPGVCLSISLEPWSRLYV